MNDVVQVVERTRNWTTINLDQFRRVAVRRSARTGELSGGKGRHGSEVRPQLSMETDNGGLDSAAGHLPGLDLATQTFYVSTAGRKLSSILKVTFETITRSQKKTRLVQSAQLVLCS